MYDLIALKVIKHTFKICDKIVFNAITLTKSVFTVYVFYYSLSREYIHGLTRYLYCVYGINAVRDAIKSLVFSREYVVTVHILKVLDFALKVSNHLTLK